MTPLQAAIEKSLELESRATKIMCAFERNPESIMREYEIRDPCGVLFRSTSYGNMKEDAEFIQHARLTHAKYVESVRVLMEACQLIDKYCFVEAITGMEKEINGKKELHDAIERVNGIWEVSDGLK